MVVELTVGGLRWWWVWRGCNPLVLAGLRFSQGGIVGKSSTPEVARSKICAIELDCLAFRFNQRECGWKGFVLVRLPGRKSLCVSMKRYDSWK